MTFQGVYPFIAFQPEFPYSSFSLHCLHAFSSLSRELQLDRSFIALVFDFLGWSVPVLSTLAARLEYSGLALSWKCFPFTFTSSTSDLGAWPPSQLACENCVMWAFGLVRHDQLN